LIAAILLGEGVREGDEGNQEDEGDEEDQEQTPHFEF